MQVIANSARILPKDKVSHCLDCETAKPELEKICGKTITRGKQLKTEPSAFSMLTPLLIFSMGSLHLYNIFGIIWYGFTDRVKMYESLLLAAPSRTTCSELLIIHGSQPNSLRACSEYVSPLHVVRISQTYTKCKWLMLCSVCTSHKRSPVHPKGVRLSELQSVIFFPGILNEVGEPH